MMMQIPTRALKAIADPACFFTSAELDRLINNVTCEEAALRDAARPHVVPMDAGDRAKLRGMVLYKICAETPPAGNC